MVTLVNSVGSKMVMKCQIKENPSYTKSLGNETTEKGEIFEGWLWYAYLARTS